MTMSVKSATGAAAAGPAAPMHRAALIDNVAAQEKIDIVPFRNVLWTRPGVDITDNIIRLRHQ